MINQRRVHILASVAAAFIIAALGRWYGGYEFAFYALGGCFLGVMVPEYIETYKENP